MRTVATFLRAFARAHTYDVRRNSYLWFGFLWGLQIPIVVIAVEVSMGRADLAQAIANPAYMHTYLHPLLLAVLFGAMGTVRAELERQNTRLVRSLTDIASRDGLTGLPNRRAVLGEIENALHRGERSGEPVAVIMFDLDKFRAVNEEGGHATGDLVLRDVASALRSVLRRGETIGRYGGDEFLAVMPGDMNAAMCFVARAVDTVLMRTGQSISAGIAVWPRDGESSERLIAAADAVLYQAKRGLHETKSISAAR